MKHQHIPPARAVLCAPSLRAVLCAAVLGGVSPALAAVPLRWEVETSRLAPVVFEAVRGETLALEAAFKSYGTPVQMPLNGCAILYQTNGMGAAWWQAPATVSLTNRVAATFSPAMDPGAPAVVGFIGATGQNYRAAFTIRFRHGPGASPNAIEKPVPVLDLAHTVVVNPPWPLTNDFITATNVMQSTLKDYVYEQITGAGLVSPSTVTNIAGRVTSNVVTKAYVEALGIESGISTNDVDAIIASSNLCTVAAAQALADTRLPAERDAYMEDLYNITSSVLFNDITYFPCGITLAGSGKIGLGGGFSMIVNNRDDQTLPEYITERTSSLASAATVSQLGANVSAISAHLNAEDARFVSTNYDSVANIPEAYCEIKINNQWRTIWAEMTRWAKFAGSAFEWSTWKGFHDWSTNVTAQLATKAERCWGVYDSETGEYSPDGLTQISSSNILIAANMSYKRVVDTANAIWVLESNSGLATLGGSNGYFRVKDGDGNTQFEIVKGNLRELGCDAGGITVDGSGATPVLTIPYSVVAATHPTLKICTDLGEADWKTEGASDCPATVAWSGSSGAYVATVTAQSDSPMMFVRATYMGGSETVINNIAPTKLQYIYIGNQKYAVGYATISGTGVMTLTPQ